MAQNICLVVDDGDRRRLASIAADRNRPQKHIQRARIVLLSAERLPVAEVTRQAGVSRPAVWRWQMRYAKAGVDALLRDRTRPPGDLSPRSGPVRLSGTENQHKAAIRPGRDRLWLGGR